MKKYAQVKNGAVANIGLFDDNADVPAGWIDITGEPGANFQDPVVNGVAVPRPGKYYEVVGGEWVKTADALKLLKANIVTELKQACEAACRAGWISEALGAPHTYETDKDRDQVTLTALAVAAMEAMGTDPTWTCPVTCIDASGVKGMVDHTADQLAQVGREVQLMIATNKATYYQLLADLETAYQAGDEAAMQAVVWA